MDLGTEGNNEVLRYERNPGDQPRELMRSKRWPDICMNGTLERFGPSDPMRKLLSFAYMSTGDVPSCVHAYMCMHVQA